MVITKSARIDVSPERLWELLTDVELVKRWTLALVSDEPISSGPPGVGYRSKMKIKEGSKIVEYESEIVTHQPMSHLGMVLRGGSLGKGPMSIDYRLTPEGAGTTLNYEARWEPHGLTLKLMSPVISVMARKNTDEAMARLKNLAEGSL